MIRLTKEQKQILDKAYKLGSTKEHFLFVYWDIFKPWKALKLMECLEKGTNWMYAFKTAKNEKRN